MSITRPFPITNTALSCLYSFPATIAIFLFVMSRTEFIVFLFSFSISSLTCSYIITTFNNAFGSHFSRRILAISSLSLSIISTIRLTWAYIDSLPLFGVVVPILGTFSIYPISFALILTTSDNIILC